MAVNLVDRLDSEWSAIAARPLDVVLNWAQLCDPLTYCRSLSDVLTQIRQAPDTVLSFLIGRYQAHDHLAGRTVLQAMLGKVVKMSYTGIAAEQPDSLNDLVTQMWCQISRYPLERRPRSVAANLALDTLKATQREWTRTGEIPVPPSVVVAELEAQVPTGDPTDEWTAESLIEAAYRLTRITATTRDILVAVYGSEGLSGDAAARRWNCSPSAIRTRCRAAVRDHLVPLGHQIMQAA